MNRAGSRGRRITLIATSRPTAAVCRGRRRRTTVADSSRSTYPARPGRRWPGLARRSPRRSRDRLASRRRFSGLEPEVRRQPAPVPLECTQRLGLAATAMQRTGHQQRVGSRPPRRGLIDAAAVSGGTAAVASPVCQVRAAPRRDPSSAIDAHLLRPARGVGASPLAILVESVRGPARARAQAPCRAPEPCERRSSPARQPNAQVLEEPNIDVDGRNAEGISAISSDDRVVPEHAANAT